MRMIDADAMRENLLWCKEQSSSYDNYWYDVIERLDAQPTVGGWISVKDRLPDMGVKCVIYRDGKMSVARHIANNDWITQAFFTYPTHWMPLYEPPKDEKDECNR